MSAGFEPDTPPRLATTEHRGLQSRADKRQPSTQEGPLGGFLIGSRTRIFTIGNVPFVASNASYDGTNWYRDVATLPAWLFTFGANDSGVEDNFRVLRAPPGSGIIAWTELLRVANNGRLTWAGVYDTGNVVMNGATYAYYTHGLGVQPRFVQVYYNHYTLAPTIPIMAEPNGVNILGSIRYYYVDNLYVAIQNTSTDAQSMRVVAFA